MACVVAWWCGGCVWYCACAWCLTEVVVVVATFAQGGVAYVNGGTFSAWHCVIEQNTATVSALLLAWRCRCYGCYGVCAWCLTVLVVVVCADAWYGVDVGDGMWMRLLHA